MNGWILIGVIVFDLVFNIAFLTTDTVRDGWSALKAAYAKAKLTKDKRFLQ